MKWLATSASDEMIARDKNDKSNATMQAMK
jgi:hypothetical protein